MFNYFEVIFTMVYMNNAMSVLVTMVFGATIKHVRLGRGCRALEKKNS